jgi:hypothetical protein
VWHVFSVSGCAMYLQKGSRGRAYTRASARISKVTAETGRGSEGVPCCVLCMARLWCMCAADMTSHVNACST